MQGTWLIFSKSSNVPPGRWLPSTKNIRVLSFAAKLETKPGMKILRTNQLELRIG
jgi:hypothetical protein